MMNNVRRTLNRTALKLKKHSPEILIVVGVIGTVASAVAACVATTKVSEILDESKDAVDSIHECLENPEMEEKYTEEDSKKDLMITYAKTGLKIAKLYAPAVILGVASISSIVTSNNILRKRNIALAAAYTTIDTSYKQYRNRVVERFGKDVDHELRYNIKAQEITETVTDEKGKEKTVKKTVNVVDPSEYSDYARFFDETSREWQRDPSYNLTFLKGQQKFANDKLIANGYLFLNEVYDALDIPRTREGQVVGWIYDPENSIGDNMVDFGIYDAYKENSRDFVNGYEPTILLDFNVDGYILDKI